MIMIWGLGNMMKNLILALALVAGLGALSKPASAQSALPLDVAALSDLTAVNLPGLTLIEAPGRYLALVNPATLNAVVQTVSTLPGVSSPAPIGPLLRGLLSNF